MKKILTFLLLAALFVGCEKGDDETPFVKLLGVKQNSGDPAVYVDLSYGNVKCATTPESGVVWATTTNPTTSSNKVIFVSQCYSGSGGNIKLSNVPAKTKLYIKGYSLTSESPGVIYSAESTITTN